MIIDPIGAACWDVRVRRGGSWYYFAAFYAGARRFNAAARRFSGDSQAQSDPTGFRLTVTLPCKTTTPVVQ